MIAVNFGAFAVFGQNFLIGIDDEHAVYAIHNHPFIVLNDLACIVQRNHRRNVQAARQDGGVAGGAAHIGDKRGNATVFEENGIGR